MMQRDETEHFMEGTHWTTELVAERLEEAAEALKWLPPRKGKHCMSLWPDITDNCDHQDWQREKLKDFLPDLDEIKRMDETLGWTIGLDPVDAKIVWMRASKLRWKEIGAKLKICQATADQRWRYALVIIASRLNGKPFPVHLSRQRVLDLACLRDERKKEAASPKGEDISSCCAGLNFA